MAIIHYSCSLCYEYVCMRRIKWCFAFSTCFLERPTRPYKPLTFPKIDTIPVNYHEYCNLLLERAQMIGRLLLEWRTQQALEYEKKNK